LPSSRCPSQENYSQDSGGFPEKIEVLFMNTRMFLQRDYEKHESMPNQHNRMLFGQHEAET
jgi:hypothetical protein